MNNDITPETKEKSKPQKIRGCLIRACLFAFLLLAAPIMMALLFPQFTLNLLYVCFEGLYFVPEQSSIFTFEPTDLGSGSETLWLYGEDKSNYYYNAFAYDAGEPVPPAGKENTIVFPKKEVGLCPGFDSKNVHTWCHSKFYMIDGMRNP